MIPGEMKVATGDIEINKGRAKVTIEVTNTGDRPIQVGSHYHFFETNDALRSVYSRETLESRRMLQMCGWSLLATFIITAPDFMQRIFATTNLTIGQWVICIAVGSLVLWVRGAMGRMVPSRT